MYRGSYLGGTRILDFLAYINVGPGSTGLRPRAAHIIHIPGIRIHMLRV
jgi:hypothetical protein